MTINHGKLIAVLAMEMGRHLGWTGAELIGVGCCALIHDNALSEYPLSEDVGEMDSLNMKKHCIKGEKNASFLPFPADTKTFILYHQ